MTQKDFTKCEFYDSCNSASEINCTECFADTYCVLCKFRACMSNDCTYDHVMKNNPDCDWERICEQK